MTVRALSTHWLELILWFVLINATLMCAFYVFDELLLHTWYPEIATWDAHIAIIFSGTVTSLVVYCMSNRLRTSLKRVMDEMQERERAQAALEQERDKFMSILESMPDGVYMVNAEHDIQYINPVIRREFGEAGDHKCYTYFHGREEPCPWCKNQEVFSGTNVRWTWHSQKSSKIYDLFDTPFKNPDGTVSKLEIFHDVTELIEAKEALRQSEERYRMLFHEANDALFMLGLNPGEGLSNYCEVNEAACQMLGYSREELLQRSPFDIVAPELVENIHTALEALVREKKLIAERVYSARDGTRVPVELSLRLFDCLGKPTILAIARDISRRKDAEDALRESEAKHRRLSQEFQGLLDAITDNLILVSPELKVLWSNKGMPCCATEQASRLEAAHCYELCGTSGIPCEDCPAIRCFLSGEVETQLSTSGDRSLSIRAFPILSAGAVHNVILVITDITEKMTLQAEAFQAAHLAALGELAAGVAHEINNPINGIINYAQILLNKSVDGSRERDVANRIIKEGDRIAGIVSSLLSFTRHSKNDKRLLSLVSVLSETLSLTEAQIRSEGIRLRLSVPEDLPPIEGNSQQIQQVFLNLLNNARYALNERYPEMHDNKILEIIGATSVVDGIHHVGLTFHDRGTGIAGEVLARVMKPFFTTKGNAQGTGMGLTISDRIITDHGGILKICSVEGEFTQVTVELPVGG
ncbi:MAG: PAS domain S-box protein [Syntrophobacteraceae bacterium]